MSLKISGEWSGKEQLNDRKQSWQTAKPHFKLCGLLKNPLKRDGLRAPSAIHSPLGSICYPIDKGNIIADCLESQNRAHDLCGCDHRRHVGAKVQALLVTDDECYVPTLRRLKIKKTLEIRRGLWFWWHSKWMSPASSKKTSCAVNTFIQSLS
jgi:hypothetical protein